MTAPILLTPGPLTTSRQTREAMLTDWGSWDSAFNALTGSVCADIVRIAGARDDHVCIPMQGSGTFAVEATLGTLVPAEGCVLVPCNGAYSERIVRILRYLRRDVCVLAHREDEPVNAARVDEALHSDAAISHVALVHCETGTGILNPLAEVAATVERHGRSLIVDAMSSFGALPINLSTLRADALIAASGKCLEGVPGFGFAVVRREAIDAAKGRSHSLALDLHDQWAYMQRTGQWRFTPPTHVVAALRSAIDQFDAQGGQPARQARYAENWRVLVSGLRALGLQTLLPDDLQSPIIVTFLAPDCPKYSFAQMYAGVRESGFILYPGKLTVTETFRVGCIGAIGRREMQTAVAAIDATLTALGVRLLRNPSTDSGSAETA
jgi:2-aminoethylphosphonate-pyruvate transaminase